MSKYDSVHSNNFVINFVIDFVISRLLTRLLIRVPGLNKWQDCIGDGIQG